MFRTYLGVVLLTAMALALIVTIAATSGPPLAHANGFTVPIAIGVSGRYEYVVGIWPPNPGVGNLHLAVTLTTDQGPVTDTQITVAGRSSDGKGAAGPLPAIGFYLQPWSYELDLNLSVHGSWSLEIEADSPLGKTGVAVPLQVADSQTPSRYPTDVQGAGESGQSNLSAADRLADEGGFNWVIAGVPLGILALGLIAWALRRRLQPQMDGTQDSSPIKNKGRRRRR